MDKTNINDANVNPENLVKSTAENLVRARQKFQNNRGRVINELIKKGQLKLNGNLPTKNLIEGRIQFTKRRINLDQKLTYKLTKKHTITKESYKKLIEKVVAQSDEKMDLSC